MAASPEQTRAGLAVVSTAAAAEVASVASSASPGELRAALFAAVPLIVGDYADGAAALALDWYEDLREDAAPVSRFVPELVPRLSDDDVATMVAVTTADLRDLDAFDAEVEQLTAEVMRDITGEVSKAVADSFRDTITGNTEADPAAAGWRRHARPGACKFCLMLAAKGAVYTEATARFAAHVNCSCIVGPEFGEPDETATAMQYLASLRSRTPSQAAMLRAYLNENFPDAPG